MTDNELKSLLSDALAHEFANVPNPEHLDYDYTFSAGFESKMAHVSKKATYHFVSVGHHRLRRALVVCLIAVLIMAAAVSVSALRRPIVNWLTSQNDKDGMLDVTFEVDDPDGLTEQFTYIKPTVPAEYEVVSEEKYEGANLYEIEYRGPNGEYLFYSQVGNIAGMGMGMDNESGTLTETTINGYKGYAYVNGQVNSITWSNHVYLFFITGTCSMDTLEEIAKKIY